jgi:hypothetical protein
MSHKLPYDLRLLWSQYRRQRYHSDPIYRLAQINASRARRGMPLLDAPKGAQRGERGRFI